MKTSIKGAAQRFIRAGYSAIPVPKGRKKPSRRAWQKLRIGEDQVDEFFVGPMNVGLLPGKPSGGVIDVDIDSPEAAAIADLFLPATEMVHGRRSKPASHRWYRVANAPAPLKFSDPDGRCLIEIRSTGQHTLVPPSIHPSGEKLRWEEEGQPRKMKTEKLQHAVAQVAAAALLVRHWPDEGSRHDASLALSGMLLRAGWSLEQTTKFVRTTVRAARDEEWKQRVADVKSTAEKLFEGGNVTGAPRLAELLGNKVVDRIREWLDLPDAASDPDAAHLTDLGNAKRLVAQHGNDIRYCHTWRKFLIWDGSRWRQDEDGEAERRAKDTVRRLYSEASLLTDDDSRAELVKWARASESRSRIVAMVELAKSEPGVPVSPKELDANPWLLNCQNGVIDLRTGELLQHRRDDLCTKIVPIVFDPDAQCPIFKQFLRQILRENVELIRFVQRCIGYSLTGSTVEQVFFILWGSGANGKSTLLEILRMVLGDYGRTADAALLMHRSHDGPRNDVARLAGARLVSTSETEAGRNLAEVLVKQLTGNDKVAARFLYSEFFEFDCQFKLFLTTNHKPVIKGTDNAIWRRIRLIPFDVTIPEEKQDKDLPRKLRSELPGILAWAVRGCLRYQECGLGQPEKVSAATQSYREEMDVLGGFLRDRCILDKLAKVANRQLYRAYKEWCESTGEKPLTQQKLASALGDRGFRRWRTGPERGWIGLALRDTMTDVT
jgi:putative DNA primase/helicase